MQDEFLRVPKDRIAVIIGHNGSTKQEIERLTGTKIEVGSENGEVSIESGGGGGVPPNAGAETGFEGVRKALSMVKAIARGFSPEKARALASDNVYLEIIDLSERFGKSEKTIHSKKGRVIGRNGKTRDFIEEMCGVSISVYGKTISIIGDENNLEKARNAIEMLLEGANHKTVYSQLKRMLAHKKFEI